MHNNKYAIAESLSNDTEYNVTDWTENISQATKIKISNSTIILIDKDNSNTSYSLTEVTVPDKYAEGTLSLIDNTGAITPDTSKTYVDQKGITNNEYNPEGASPSKTLYVDMDTLYLGNDYIKNELNRDFTHWDAKGGYDDSRTYIIYTALTKYELIKLERELKKLKTPCFMVKSEGVGIKGEFKKEF